MSSESTNNLNSDQISEEIGEVSAEINPDEAEPKPWIFHILLSVMYISDAILFQFAVKFLNMNIPQTYFRVAANTVLVALVILTLKNKRNLPPNKIVRISIATLCAYAFFGTAITVFRVGIVSQYVMNKTIVLLFLTVPGLWVISRVLDTKKDIVRFATVYVICGLWILLIASPVLIRGEIGKLTVTSKYFEVNLKYMSGLFNFVLVTYHDLGRKIAPVVFLTVIAVKNWPLIQSKRIKLLITYLLEMIFYFLVIASGHRTTILAVTLAYIYRAFKSRNIKILLMIIFMLFVIWSFLNVESFGRITRRLKTFTQINAVGSDRSFSERAWAWKESMKIIKEHPFIGIGFGEYPVQLGLKRGDRVYPHNLLMETWLDVGIILGSIIAIILVLPLVVIGLGLKNETSIALFCMVFVTLFNTLTNGDTIYNHNTYMLIGIMPIIMSLSKNETE